MLVLSPVVSTGKFAMDPVSDVLRPLWRILRTTAQLWWKHWPALLVISILAWAGHEFFLSLAVFSTRTHALLSFLILPFAPLSALVGYIAILHYTAPSLMDLPSLRKKEGAAAVTSFVGVVSASILPFLALYAAQGTAKADKLVFLRDVFTDHLVADGLLAPEQLNDRYGYSSPLLIIAVVLIAVLIRRIISALKLNDKFPTFRLFSGYLEALWLVSLAGLLNLYTGRITEWFHKRAMVSAVIERSEGLIEWWNTPSLPDFITQPWGDFNGLLTALIITPLATLTVAAAVYGATFDNNPMEFGLTATIEERLDNTPSFLKRGWNMLAQYVADIFATVRKTLAAVRKVMAAGVGPVIMMSLLVAAAGHLRTPLTMAARALVGPQAHTVWYVLKPYTTLFVEALFMAITVPLVAACSASIARARREQLAAERATQEVES